MRKATHGSIVAPLAALAALGAGVAIAMAGRERRVARDRREQRRPGRRPEESSASALQRAALEQLDLAVALLCGADRDTLDAATVHELRKALKRLRAQLRLLRPFLGEKTYARETEVARRAGRSVADARDREVMLACFEELLDRGPRELAGAGSVKRLRIRLARERDAARAAALDDPQSRAQLISDLRLSRERVAAWRTAQGGEDAAVERGLLALYAQGRRRHRRAVKRRGSDAERMHEWRKRVKDLRHGMEALTPLQPPPAGGADTVRAAAQSGGKRSRRAREKRRRADEARGQMMRLAKRADVLGELLGEEHDLGELDAWIAAQPVSGPGRAIGRRRRRALRRLIAKRRRRLRKRALRKGERLYARKPKRFVREVRAAMRAALPLASS